MVVIQVKMILAKVCPKDPREVFSKWQERCPTHNCMLEPIYGKDPIRIPGPCCKCGQEVTIKDYEANNFNVRDGKLRHEKCPKEVKDEKPEKPKSV